MIYEDPVSYGLRCSAHSPMCCNVNEGLRPLHIVQGGHWCQSETEQKVNTFHHGQTLLLSESGLQKHAKQSLDNILCTKPQIPLKWGLSRVLTSIYILGTAVVNLPTSLNLGNNTSGTRFSRLPVSADTNSPLILAFLPTCTSHLSRSSQVLEGTSSWVNPTVQRPSVIEVNAGTEEMEDRMAIR